MSERLDDADEKAMAARLRQEDLDARPPFSEELHGRICRAIQLCRAGESRVHQRREASRRAFRWLACVAAAACVVAVAAWIWNTRGPSKDRSLPEDGAIAQHAPVEPPQPGANHSASEVDLSAVTGLSGRVSARIPVLVDSSLASHQWAYLDHDARLTMEMLADRIPLGLASAAPRPEPEAIP